MVLRSPLAGFAVGAGGRVTVRFFRGLLLHLLVFLLGREEITDEVDKEDDG